MKNQATTNNESGRKRSTWRGRFSSSLSDPTQFETATNTEVIYLIILSFINNIYTLIFEFQVQVVYVRGRGRGLGKGRKMPQERNMNELHRGRWIHQYSQTSFEALYSARGLQKGKRLVEHETPV